MLEQYKKILELEGWKIWVCIASPTRVKFNLKTKEAVIQLDKGDLPYKDYWILHELVHVRYPNKKEWEINSLTVKLLKTLQRPL